MLESLITRSAGRPSSASSLSVPMTVLDRPVKTALREVRAASSSTAIERYWEGLFQAESVLNLSLPSIGVTDFSSCSPMNLLYNISNERMFLQLYENGLWPFGMGCVKSALENQRKLGCGG